MRICTSSPLFDNPVSTHRSLGLLGKIGTPEIHRVPFGTSYSDLTNAGDIATKGMLSYYTMFGKGRNILNQSGSIQNIFKTFQQQKGDVTSIMTHSYTSEIHQINIV